MKRFFILYAVFILSVNTQAQNKTKQVYAFSLEECVSFAKNNNVQVKNSLLAIDVQVQTNREIAAAAYPTIGTNLSGTDYLVIPILFLFFMDSILLLQKQIIFLISHYFRLLCQTISMV